VELLTVISLTAVFFLVALLNSNLGLGGGVLYVPLMLMALPGEPKEAVVCTSLFFTISTAIPAMLNHHKLGHLDTGTGFKLAAGAMAGAVLGTFVNLSIDRSLFVLAFSGLLLVLGARFLADSVRKKRAGKGSAEDEDGPDEGSEGRVAAASGMAAGSGLASSLFGIGGGVLNVPILHYVVKMGLRRSMGTSFLIILFTAPVGIATYVLLGTPPFWTLVAVGIPTILAGSYIGSKLGLKKLRTSTVSLILVGLMFVIAGKMLLELAIS